MALPEWGEVDGKFMLFVKSHHSLTKQPMEIAVAHVIPLGVSSAGKTKGKMIYKLTLLYEVEEGTSRYNRLVRHGALERSPDGRYYQPIERSGLTLSEAQIMAMTHAPVSEEDLDQDAEETGWGSLDYTLTVEKPELALDNVVTAQQIRDHRHQQKLAQEMRDALYQEMQQRMRRR